MNSKFDSICDEFESRWQRGECPDIGEAVKCVEACDRPGLLFELLQIELWWTRDHPPALNDYLRRFPRFDSVVAEAFTQFRAATATAAMATTQESQSLRTHNESNNVHSLSATVTQPNSGFPNRGQLIGDYELLGEIARGGMGVVFKARQIALNRIVALKMILAGEMAGPEQLQRFRTEAEAAARLDHPGIVPIFEIGEHNGQSYFSMGYVDGRSLDALSKEGPLTPEFTAKVMREIAEAVAYAHERGVIHRDLKPANVLMDSDGNPKVTDFGLAKQVGSDSDLTRTGSVMGTPSFMPPEQARGDAAAVGPQSDVYSLGAILYCLLVGRPPHHAASAVDILVQVIETTPVQPRALNPALPKDLETICLKCLEKSPAQRYGSAREFVDELTRFLSGHPIHARPISLREKTVRWCRRNPTISILTAAIVVLLLAGTAISSALAFSAIESAELAESKAKEAVRSLVMTVSYAPADRVWEAIESLVPFRQQAMTLLELNFDKATGVEKLQLGCGLARLGRAKVDYLVGEVGRQESRDVRNVLKALRFDSKRASEKIIQRFESTPESNAKQLTRLAVAACDLGSTGPARTVLRRTDAPSLRSAFINTFTDLATDDTSARELIQNSTENDVLYGMILAFGKSQSGAMGRTKARCETMCRVIRSIQAATNDNGVHAAATWALARWDRSAVPGSSQKPMSRFVDRAGLTMIRVPSGSFIRSDAGAAAEVKSSARTVGAVSQKVTISRDLFFSQHEVTIGQFSAFARTRSDFRDELVSSTSLNSQLAAVNQTVLQSVQNGIESGTVADGQGTQLLGTERLPAYGVSWRDAAGFCNWLSELHDLPNAYRSAGDSYRLEEGSIGYRLPTEAEWEYAARAGTTTPHYFGATELLPAYAAPLRGDLMPVGSYMPNRFGLFDIYGNVSEWCNDFYGSYGRVSVIDPRGPQSGTQRIQRGGSIGDSVGALCSATRAYASEVERSSFVGFRVVRSTE